ncbi:MAG TPA: DNA primase [Sedimentisphaerales bacterium]|nr:DNA primase [Sedimentisphaerales bacterium]
MAGSFDKALVNQVLQANDIVDVIAEHLSLTKKGREMVGLCPFHDDHRPSLFVNPTKQIFKCFACGAGGSVFNFVQMRENLTFPQALERLAQRAGIKISPTKDKQTQTPEGDPNELARVNAWAATHFQQNLLKNPQGKYALDYIAQRQITPESVKKWQLGLALNATDDLIRAANTLRIPQRLLVQAGLVTGNKTGGLSDKFVNRLMFPITDVTARVIGFGGRTLDDAEAKYVNSPTTALFDKSNSLYGLQHARHNIVATGDAVVVEGYTDCIMAHQSGCTNVVAALGTSFTGGQARILRRYAKRVVLIFDSDAAGVEAANRALEICLAQHIDIKLASVPQAKDPCDFLLAAGKEQFEKLIEQALDVFEFKWNRLTQNFAADDTLVDNKAAVEEFLQTIATGILAGRLSAIEKGLIVNRLTRIIGLTSKEINAELTGRIARTARTAAYNTQARSIADVDWGQGFFAVAQREILEVLLNEPRLLETLDNSVTPELFDVPILRQVSDIVFETLTAEPSATLSTILARAESPQQGAVIVELAQTGEKKGNFQRRLAGALDGVRRFQAQKTKSELKTLQDSKQLLQRFVESAAKNNPRSLGMT